MTLRIGVTDSLLFNLEKKHEWINDEQEVFTIYYPAKGLQLMSSFVRLNTLCQTPPIEFFILSTLVDTERVCFQKSLDIHGFSQVKTIYFSHPIQVNQVLEMNLDLFLSLDHALCQSALSQGILSVVPNQSVHQHHLKILFNCPFFLQEHLLQRMNKFLIVLGYIQKSSHLSCEISIWVNHKQQITSQIRQLFYLTDCKIDSVVFDSNCNGADVLWFLKPDLCFYAEDTIEDLRHEALIEDKNSIFLTYT